MKFYPPPFNEGKGEKILQALSPDIQKSLQHEGANNHEKNNRKYYAYANATSTPITSPLFIHLITASGNEIYQWKFNLKKNANTQTLSLKTNSIRAFDIFQNGNVLVISTQSDVTPWGGPMIMLDKKSNIMWMNNLFFHHDFSMDSQEKIYGLSHDYASPKIKKLIEKLFFYIKPNTYPILDDNVTTLNKKGTVLDQFSIYEAMEKSDINFKQELFILRARRKTPNIYWDRLHANSIEYIANKNQTRLSLKQKADLMVNLRDLNIILFLNAKQKKVIGYVEGPWSYAHSPKLLDNGNILIFDNLNQWPKSRVLEYDPKDKSVKWMFYKDKLNKKSLGLSSPLLGRVEVLRNGDKIISSWAQHRILDVSPTGKLNWEYYTLAKDKNVSKGLVSARGFFPDELPFLTNVN